MEKLKPGQEITYEGKKRIVRAFKKYFADKKYVVIFEGEDAVEHPWPEPRQVKKEVEEVPVEVEEEVPVEDEELEVEEDRKLSPKLSRKKKSKKS